MKTVDNGAYVSKAFLFYSKCLKQ